MKLVVSCQLSVVRQEILLCILSALLLILSFPQFNLEFLAWFAFVPLFLGLENKSKGRAFLLSYLTGVIFWLGIIYWLAHVTLAGLIALVLYLALYFGIFGFLISTYRVSGIFLFFIPAGWVILEYLRSHLFTGFPWALLGYSQYLNLPVIQIADVTGVWGVSFLVMMINAAIYSVISRKLSVVSIKEKYLLPIFILLITLSYGYFKIYHLPLTTCHLPLKISVIQGNIPQELKWRPESNDYIIEKYLDISFGAVKDNPDLIIWPEAALPVVLEEEPSYYEKLKDFIKEARRPLLLGAVTKRDNFYYNSALLLSREASLLSRYDKLHLVPFGEYIPLRKILGFLETVAPIGDFNSGKEYTIFKIPDNFAVLICFEDLFPEISREFVKKGANFLVNITNDAWFKKTSSPYQHLQASVFRAVENRVAVVRAANTGVSGFIAPTGKIISLVGDKSGENIFISGYQTEGICLPQAGSTFYNRSGDIFILFSCLLFILGATAILKKKP